MPLIVIVDDRTSNRAIFAKLAASIEKDIEVRTFGDPVEALQWLAGTTPDLVITDYKMPQIDGAEFIRRFRELPDAAEVPVIVITVYEERTFRLRALEAGATDFLHSPVDHHEFVTRARNSLRLYKHQQATRSQAETLRQKLELSERSRESALRDSRERLAQVIDTVPVMISAAAPDGSLIFANAHQTSVSGIEPNGVVGQDVSVLFGLERGARSQALDKMIFDTGRALPGYEEEIVDWTGAHRTVLTNKAPLYGPDNTVVGVLTSSLDITARKRIEANLHRMAHHDALTDLPNRTLLREKMRIEIGRARRGDNPFALHLIDLDGFKAVNDVRGHSMGDRYLKAMAAKLQAAMRASDTIARLGGDEFAILQSNVPSSEDAAEFAARLLSVIAEPLSLAGEEITTTGSIGIVLHPTDGTDGEDLLKSADLAMYRAKAEGGNLFCFYAADMNTRARQAALLDTELRTALAEGQFELHYQPQIDLATGQICGAEALLRWRQPGVGLVGPAAFLSRAEENGLIIAINDWVLQEACREARTWNGPGLRPLRVGVNMSPIQFRKRDVPALVARCLHESGLDPSLLDLELTESIVMDDIEAVAGDLCALVKLGTTVSIDDFGTGYSSLSYVKRLPVQRLKIDQSFVRSLTSDANDAAIVRAIVTLGHSLGLRVVAEGVETAEQLARLRIEGCDEVQGYLFGRAMPAADFLALARGPVTLALTA